MADSSVQSLLGAVRRRMWRSEFVAAARLALWGTAGLMLLAAAVHLAIRSARVGVVLSLIVVLWGSMMARAASRRPSDSACALWADRYLGGASAFSTVLEMSSRSHMVVQGQALPWLQHWSTARVPHSLRLLQERRDPPRLSRPLLSMLVCAAFASLVLSLPNLAPSTRQERAASSAAGSTDGPSPEAEPPVSTKLVGELARALRSPESLPTSDRRDGGRAPAAGPGKSNEANGSQVAPFGAAAPGVRATGGQTPGGNLADGARTTGTTSTSSTGAGRDAGDSPDNRADTGTSRVLRSTMPMERRESSAPGRSPERRADMDQPATFDEDLSMPRTAEVRADPAPAAATPPAAADTPRLTPSQAAYVQAWIRASGQRR